MRASIIIPTLNEEACLERAIVAARNQGPVEIIVVDGGSRDRTRQIAQSADRFIESSPGRAVQMNRGAAAAGGDLLVFLHADCVLEQGAMREAIRRAGRPGFVAGCFRMRVEAEGLLYRSIDACATARVRCTGLAYGDQGLFLRRDCYELAGGFPEYRLMEDLFFSRALRSRGRIDVTSRRIYVSPRRWQKVGLVRQSIRNWALTILAGIGAHPDRLARLYPAIR